MRPVERQFIRGAAVWQAKGWRCNDCGADALPKAHKVRDLDEEE